MVGGGAGREGDWECGSCGNRNYAFRCFCNRCKQPRLLVDNKTPADSKWLPRIGDWICTGTSAWLIIPVENTIWFFIFARILYEGYLSSIFTESKKWNVKGFLSSLLSSLLSSWYMNSVMIMINTLRLEFWLGLNQVTSRSLQPLHSL